MTNVIPCSGNPEHSSRLHTTLPSLLITWSFIKAQVKPADSGLWISGLNPFLQLPNRQRLSIQVILLNQHQVSIQPLIQLLFINQQATGQG